MKKIFLGMRVALKIAYDGRAFFGHQRQPDRRTVEGECLAALRAAQIVRDPHESFFRSASRTDRGVSAVGNVIAFNTNLAPEAVVGAFNDRSRDVWAWAAAAVPASFHPRHALQRWYRYHILDDLPLPALRRAGSLFVGEHDFRSFTSDPLKTALTIDEISVTRSAPVILFDIRARTFRRSMVRRIVAATIRHANGESSEAELQAALGGSRQDFGIVRPEPLFLMDVCYPFSMDVILKHRVRDAWLSIGRDAELRVRLIEAWHRAAFGES